MGKITKVMSEKEIKMKLKSGIGIKNECYINSAKNNEK